MSYTESLPYEVEKTARLLHLAAKNNFTKKIKGNITPEEFIILDTLINHPGVSQSDLSKLVLKGRSHTRKMLVSLEEKGYIERIQSTKNGKMIFQTDITKQGMQLFEEVHAILKADIQEWFDTFGDETLLRNELKRLQKLILANAGEISLE